MTPGTRRAAKGVLLLLLLVVVAGLSAYLSRNFTGAGPMPQRSTFARRLPALAEGDGRHFRFFFLTNRDAAPSNDLFEGHGRVIGDRLVAGTFDVRIEPHTPISPDAWWKTSNMKLLGHTVVEEDELFGQIREAVRASPGNSLLVIVWGWKDRFATGALKSAFTAYALDINTPVLMFDWPGNQGDGPLGYFRSRRMAHQSGPDLGRVLARLAQDTGSPNIWLLSSSLGCQTVSDAFSWMLTETDLATSGPRIGHVVMSAPDVGDREFNERFAAKMKALADHLTVYVSSNDQALLLSNWFNRRASLGRSAVSRPATAPAASADQEKPYDSQFDAAADLLDAYKDDLGLLQLVDVTPINRTRNMHHFFTDAKEFFDDLFLRLQRPDDHTGRNLYPIRDRERGGYWILWDQ